MLVRCRRFVIMDEMTAQKAGPAGAWSVKKGSEKIVATSRRVYPGGADSGDKPRRSLHFFRMLQELQEHLQRLRRPETQAVSGMCHGCPGLGRTISCCVDCVLPPWGWRP